MKHLKKFNEENEYHDIQECMIGETHTITDTNIAYVIDGEEYSFTLREHSNITGSDYKFEFLPDHDTPFELTKEMQDKMWKMYEQQV